MNELTLEILDKAISMIEGERNVIVGFVVSPSDYRSIKEGTKVLWAVDDIKAVLIPPYKGLELYVSDMVENGKPIPLTKRLQELKSNWRDEKRKCLTVLDVDMHIL